MYAVDATTSTGTNMTRFRLLMGGATLAIVAAIATAAAEPSSMPGALKVALLGQRTHGPDGGRAFPDVKSWLETIASTLESVVSAQTAASPQQKKLATHASTVKERIATIRKMAARVHETALDKVKEYVRQDDVEVTGNGAVAGQPVSGTYKCRELTYSTSTLTRGQGNTDAKPDWSLPFNQDGSRCSKIHLHFHAPDWRDGEPMKARINNCVADVVEKCTVKSVAMMTVNDMTALNTAIAEALEGLALDQEAVNNAALAPGK